MMHRMPAALLALFLALTLAGCGGGDSSGHFTTSCAASAPPVSAGSSSVPEESTDVTAEYQDRLLGAYSGEHDMAYRFAEDGKLTVAVQGDDGNELTDGSWWVQQEGDTVYLYTNLQGAAHPARYTFELSEKKVLSLYDDTTGELSDLLTPYTCGVFP